MKNRAIRNLINIPRKGLERLNTDYLTLSDLIRSRRSIDQKGITFIINETEECFLSYRDLYDHAVQILVQLQRWNLKPGEEVIIQIDDNHKFILVFWACILGGFIPVPISVSAHDEHRLKLFRIWRILQKPHLVTNRDWFEKVANFASKSELSEVWAALTENTIYWEDLMSIPPSGFEGEPVIHQADSGDIAFIQFSSGSTGDPKGAMITHRNVLLNLTAVIRWAKITADDSGLNWMPLTHDMGLIGTHIKGLLAGINQYNMSTSLFIRRPTLWIEKANQHRVSLLYSPNFGYKHFLKFLSSENKRDWDLSNIRLIYNGAEPISLELCHEFLETLAPYGLQRNAMYPVYGLAEGTIAVTFPVPGSDIHSIHLNRDFLAIGEAIQVVAPQDPKRITFVEVGSPIEYCELRIGDEKDRDLGEERIGYIQIRGGNVTSGYYHNEKATRQAINAAGWLNTGDLGFVRNQKLYVTGRAKDVIFIAGQNYYSHDIERVAETANGMELGKIAAVGVFNEKLQSDELVLFVLFKQKPEKFLPLIVDLKKVVNRQLGIEVSGIIPVKSLPKTTSGKIQRYKLREGYLHGDFQEIIDEIHRLCRQESGQGMEEFSGSPTEEKLAVIWSEILHSKKIQRHDDFFALGGDSLRATQLISRIQDSFGVRLEQESLFGNSGLGQLAAIIDQSESVTGDRFILHQYDLPATGKFPLSYSQQGLWFIDRLYGGSPQYNLSSALRIRGGLNPEILEKSFQEIFKRHTSLRISFFEEDGRPFQQIHPELNVKVEVIDLKGIPQTERELAAFRHIRKMANRPFQLEEAPLFRIALFWLDESESILAMAAHHLIFDGWSFSILLRELAFFYEQFALANATDTANRKLPELTIQYPDYVMWQMERFERNELAEQWDYWKQQLAGKLPALHLPLDKPRPAVQTFHGAKMIKTLPDQLKEDLLRIARREGVTLYMLLLGAFYTLLYRYTGEEDIIVGTSVANRNHQVLEPLIGFFTNNLVLRNRLSGDIGFSELLSRVKKATLAAYANQDIPFEKIVSELHPERDMSQNPVFQVSFSLQNTPNQLTKFAGLDLFPVDINSDFARFDLAIDIWEKETGLSVIFEYNTNLFLEATIGRMAGHFQQLLEGVIADSTCPLNAYQILTPLEKQRILEEPNRTGIDFNDDPCWVKLFETRAAQNPGAIAVVAGDRSMTYDELNRQSNQLAHYLRSLQVGAEVVAGVYLERSAMMLVGLLGIHKAGGAYLPLDPIFPKQRIEYMLDDAQISILLTQKSLRDSLPEMPANIICLDTFLETAAGVIATYPDQNPNLSVAPSNLAYLIYTSGSTGKPKGVQIEHSSLSNFLRAMSLRIDIGTDDRLLAVTTLSFDIAALELFLPLTVGAGIVMAGRDEVISGEALVQKLTRHNITMMQATPATWRMLLESNWRGKPDLKILCGGEALSRDLATELLKRAARVWNVYGPTETTIWSTMTEIKAPLETVSIGTPIANTQVYILDAWMNPVPVGVCGGLYIGGAGLARGYWKQPELTLRKFVPNPFSGHPGDRLYQTGDLAKFLADGTIECLGRMDHQVKIRGYRIELGEIEAVLNQFPTVEESVVIAKELRPGDSSLVAYLIPTADAPRKEINTGDLRVFLRKKLPEYMIPAAFAVLHSFPLTPNGKIDRLRLPMPETIEPQSKEDKTAPANGIEAGIVKIWQEVLRLERIGIHDNFFDLGGHSLLLGQVQSKIRNILEIEIEMLDLLKYPTISTLTKYLGQQIPDKKPLTAPSRDIQSTNKDIAVIGLAGRFPGARSIHEFWANLCDGIESIARFSDEELLAGGISPDLLSNPRFVKAWGALDGIDRFDAAFFGYNPNEAAVLDPQQRIFLEEAWHALENAGYDSEKYSGLIGVFAGTGMNTYMRNLHDSSGELANDYQIMISNDKDFLATRVAYKLNLEGPGITVQTACSTSLVAIHLACRSLDSNECDLALAGGVSVRLPQPSGYLYQEGMILSPDGHCRTFDASAQGTVGGNGVGIVVLKRLDDALADGDTVYAVIKGSAINNDGALKVGFTAPRSEGQAKVIAEAQARAGISPETITYVETHGTGTPLGDPIEIQALTQAFRENTDEKGFCAIGSAKTNIGHLDAAAGVTGFIKTVMALRHRKIPPSLHFKTPNPEIDFENSPFFVNTRLVSWEPNTGIRRAGVSSFGIGGTNAHVVLEEAPTVNASPGRTRSYQLLVFSAKTPGALEQMTVNFLNFVKGNPGLNIADAAYTLQMGRKEFDHRRIAVVNSVENTVQLLEGKDPKRVFNMVCDHDNPRIVFMFPGQGSQYVNMGLGLYREEPVFRDAVDQCASILEPYLGFDLRQVIYPQDEAGAQADARLKQTAVTQPALFTIEYATAKLWQSWGLVPQAMIGHSIGEYVAACLAGVLSLEQALHLVASRGKLMEQLPAGAMLTVALEERAIQSYLNDELSLAAANGPLLNVVSGSISAIEKLENELQAKGVICRRLHTSHAFHSWMMDPVIREFTALVSQNPLKAPSIPYISNVTGTWITPEEAVNPRYWATHLRQAVRFGAGVQELLKNQDFIFLEVGPGNTLSSLVKQQAKAKSALAVLSSIRHVHDEQPDEQFLQVTFGRLWLSGIKINWPEFNHHQTRLRIPLPGYPFESKRYWITKPLAPVPATSPAFKTKNIDDWFYVPVWKQSTQHILLDESDKVVQNWLILGESHPLLIQITQRLRQMGRNPIQVQAGPSFQKINPDHFVINSGQAGDYERLIQTLQETGTMPDTIINGWGITTESETPRFETVTGEKDCWFYSSLFLAQAIGGQNVTKPVTIEILSNQLHKIFNETVIYPEKATLLGPCRVIPQEYPNINCRSVDLVIPEPGSAAETELLDKLMVEFHTKITDRVIAYRGGERWSQQFEPAKLENRRSPAISLKQGGVYIITGGWGGIGLVLAEHLAREAQARLVLIGRADFPAPEKWPEWLANHPETDPISDKIKRLQSCRALGANIMICRADVADPAQMSQVIRRVETEFGAIHGVFHAAGNPGGGMIQLKKKEFVERVFRPKIEGTLVLYEFLKNKGLDFVIFCSSINAVTGGFGQVDYSSANAFLDAFAQVRDSLRGTRYISIDWDRWPGVGMADAGSLPIPAEGRNHPLLGRMKASTGERTIFLSEFRPEKLWVLNEHLVFNIPTIAGTTYLEMIRAALAEMGYGVPLKISDVVFLSPLTVQMSEIREVFTIIRQGETAYDFRIISRYRMESGSKPHWQEHVRGTVTVLELTSVEDEAGADPTVFIGDCHGKAISFSEDQAQTGTDFIRFGKRWQTLRKIHLGQGQAVVEVELGSEFNDDLHNYPLHPALLDVLTGSLRLIAGGNYLPFSYGEVIVYQPLASKLYAHIQYLNDLAGTPEIISCNLNIMDSKGLSLIRVENFSMKLVSPLAASEFKTRAAAASQFEDIRLARWVSEWNLEDNISLNDGIAVIEGLESWRRIFQSAFCSRIIVSTKDLAIAMERENMAGQPKIVDELAQISAARELHSRPDLKNDFVAPKSEAEKQIGSIWQELLGIETVGIHDDFFELGGNSLVLIQLHTKLKEKFQTDLAVVDLYKYNTVAALARNLQQDRTEQPAFTEVSQRVNRQKEIMKQKREQMMQRRKINEP
jgi:amino acid adenylation domain-containing protein